VWWGVLNDEDFATVFNDEPLVTNTEIVTGNVDIVSYAGANLVQLAHLREVGGALTISNNPALTTVSLPVLEVVGGNLTIQGNGLLESFSTPSLAKVGTSLLAGTFTVTGNTVLDDLYMPCIDDISRLEYKVDFNAISCNDAEAIFCEATTRPLFANSDINPNAATCELVVDCLGYTPLPPPVEGCPMP
jgi:hypothetical protein